MTDDAYVCLLLSYYFLFWSFFYEIWTVTLMMTWRLTLMMILKLT